MVKFTFSPSVNATLKASALLEVVNKEQRGNLSLHNIVLSEVNAIKAWAMLNDWEISQKEFERETSYKSGVYVPYISLSLAKGNFDIHFFTVSFHRD